MIKGRVLIGGSGSTGSSLLKNILNRHPEIYSGTESALFSKKQLYVNWQKARTRIFRQKWFGLKNHGWHRLTGVNLPEDEYHKSIADIKALALKSTSFQNFADALLISASENQSQNDFIWIDKTPSNAACFKIFLENFDNAKVIHMTRNPLDTIASLIARGYNLYYAVGIYLLNAACAVKVKDNPSHFQIKYEDLVLDPIPTIKSISQFMDIRFDESILKSKGENVPDSKLEGWTYDETADIGNKSIGKFKKLPASVQEDIISALYQVKISKAGQQFYQVQATDIKDVSEILDYEIPHSNNKNIDLHKFKRYDQLYRVLSLNKTGWNYPLTI